MTNSADPTPEAKLSRLAVAALVLSLIPCTFVAGIILGVIALVRIHKPELKLRGRAMATAAILIPLVMGPLTFAVAWPSFRSYGCRAKQSEARFTLKSLHALEQSHRLESGAFSADVAAIGFAPSGTVRYAYRILEATPERYRAEALALDPTLGGDRWTIDEAGEPAHVVDGCD